MTSATGRVWNLATAAIVVAVIALGWFLGAGPQLAAATRLDTERNDVIAQNVALQAATDELAADFSAISSLREQLSEVQAEFPTNADYAAISETLLTALATAGIDLNSVLLTFASPVSVDVVTDELGQVPAGTLMRVPVSITVLGEFSDALLFIETLQLSERFVFVSAVSYSQGTSPERNTSVSLAFYAVSAQPISVEPDPGAETSTEAETEPTPSPTPSP